jgi:hypothetical protein
MATLQQLQLIAHGQTQRKILNQSQKGYLSRCKTITEVLNRDAEVRSKTLEVDDNGIALMHTGDAKRLYKLKLPMSVEAAELLFAAISVDDTLPKKRNLVNATDEGNNANIVIDPLNPAQHKQTVTSQTYQNYKSALKWWHTFNSPEMSKIGYPFPVEVDVAINGAVQAYKRDVGAKKRSGVMSLKEGKAKYDLAGYIAICTYFCKLRPEGHKHTWLEGIFAGLFTKLSVHTIGRSDNIDDLLLCMMDWNNDAMTVIFGTTKADQAGETTSEKKHIFANPFRPEICVILALAVYTWCKRRSPGKKIIIKPSIKTI